MLRAISSSQYYRQPDDIAGDRDMRLFRRLLLALVGANLLIAIGASGVALWLITMSF